MFIALTELTASSQGRTRIHFLLTKGGALLGLVPIALAAGIVACFTSEGRSDEIDRPGVGYWCYNPVRTPSYADKKAFVAEVSGAAIAAERRWGVPAPVIAAMSIVESGYGTTRLAIKANNILAYKWPGDTLAAGRKKFVLWCQPPEDKGNVYPAFASRGDAVSFVASRLKLSPHYRAATAAYATDLAKKVARQAAARKWLDAIAPAYNWRPREYVVFVSGMADNPLGDGSLSLWSLRP